MLSLADTIILIRLLLGAFVSSRWLLLSAFVGLNLLQSSISWFCPAALVFHRLGVPGGCASYRPNTTA